MRVVRVRRKVVPQDEGTGEVCGSARLLIPTGPVDDAGGTGEEGDGDAGGPASRQQSSCRQETHNIYCHPLLLAVLGGHDLHGTCSVE